MNRFFAHVATYTAVLAFCGSVSLAQDAARIELHSADLVVGINNRGLIESLKDASGRNLLLQKHPSPLLRLKSHGAGELEQPRSMTWSREADGILLTLEFSRSRAVVKATEKDDYLVFELESLEGDDVEVITWGPLYTTINKTVANVLGAVYDEHYAVGMMSLNLKTTGGHYTGPSTLPGDAAKASGGGGSLQAFARDRTRSLDGPAHGAKLRRIKGIEGETCEGSRIAIYGAPRSGLLDRVGLIERQEDLFHATHEGEWIKQIRYPTATWLKTDYSPANLDACLELAEKSGTHVVYSGTSIFRSWGTFEPAMGMEALKACAAKAKERGVILGVHTLSNFITPNDPLVTPVPHPGLQLDGVSTLKVGIDAAATEVVLADDTDMRGFEVGGRGTIPAVRVGDELITFSAVSDHPPWTLTGCRRGAFGTQVSAHEAGSEIGKLSSHSYGVFLPDIHLQDQVAVNLANFFKESGLEALSFDGLEGCWVTGHGMYACERFVKVFFEHLDNRLMLTGSSTLSQFLWRYVTNLGWGEPLLDGYYPDMGADHWRWVEFFDRNLMPSKVGSFEILSKTSLEYTHWVMGMCAGYDGGGDFHMPSDFMSTHPQAEEALAIIKTWETARMEGFFTEEQRKNLRDIHTIYRLVPKGDSYELQFVRDWFEEAKEQERQKKALLTKYFGDHARGSVISPDYVHVNRIRDAEQRIGTRAYWGVHVEGRPQPLQYVLRSAADNTQVIRDAFFLKGVQTCPIPFEIKPGEYVLALGDGTLRHFTAEGTLIDEQPIKDIPLESGKNSLEFDTAREGDNPGPKVIVNFKTYLEGYSLTTGKPVTSSNNSPDAALANDGKMDDALKAWRAPIGKRGSAWWQVDLEKPEVIRELVLAPYPGRRYYEFTIETSLDGENWETTVDQSENTVQVPGLQGYRFEIPPTTARYIKVRILSHRMGTPASYQPNGTAFITEMMAF